MHIHMKTYSITLTAMQKHITTPMLPIYNQREISKPYAEQLFEAACAKFNLNNTVEDGENKSAGGVGFDYRIEMTLVHDTDGTSYKTEFNEADYTIPSFINEKSGWIDNSWGNDAHPCFHNDRLGLCVWIAENEVEKRGGAILYTLHKIDEEGSQIGADLLATNEEQELLQFIMAIQFSAILHGWLTPEQQADVLAKNDTPEYQNGACATHNHCNPNEAVLETFEKVLGREWVFNDAEKPETEEQNSKDTALGNKLWDIARENKFWFTEVKTA